MANRSKFTVEYPIRSSPQFLFPYLSTASGLSEWFADDVNVNGDVYTFSWDGSEERAKLVTQRMNKYVKFQWVDRENEYFSIEIDQDELTGDVVLVITDFDNEGDVESAQGVYTSALDQLKGTIGG